MIILRNQPFGEPVEGLVISERETAEKEVEFGFFFLGT